MGHNRTMHLKDNNIQCDQCEHISSTKRGLIGHNTRFHKGDVFKCHICKSIVVTEDGLQKHIQSGRCKENCCDECGKVYNSKTSLAIHVNIHRSKSEKVYNFNCEKCGKCLTSKHSLTEHYRSHDNKPFPCKIFPEAGTTTRTYEYCPC